MTIYEAYLEGKLYPSVTRRGIIFHCELYALFSDVRKELKYEQALYTVADIKSTSPKTVEAALSTVKKPL